MAHASQFPTFCPALASGEWSDAQLAILQGSPPQALADWLITHELGALAYLRLKEANLAAPLQIALAPVYWQAAGAAAIKLDLLARLQTALAAAGVQTVLLKGIAFYLTIYPDPAVRPMNDLDLWLQPGDVPIAWQVMADLGFHDKGLWPDATAIPPHVTQLDFYPGDLKTSPLSVELHWDLSQREGVRGRLPLARWWAEAISVPWRDQSVKVLSSEAALVHTAVHQILEHRAEIRWRWLLDIDQLARGRPDYHLTPADWQQAAADANEAGVLPAVQAALRLIARELATPLPEPALDLLVQKADPVQRERAIYIANPHRSAVGKVLLNAQNTSGWQRKTAVILPTLFPHPSYMQQRYHVRHRALLPVYYLARLLKGVAIALKSVIREP
ncbi:MAG TPA: nucleotidyltransferase family protein [Chloroflexota bacterium]|nr:nucleotidyltransferase family protein [Chloroflexota bacterium]